MKNERHPLALRIPKEQLDEIDKRADRAKLSRTEYMVRAALGKISDPRNADERLADVERRLAALERAYELSH